MAQIKIPSLGYISSFNPYSLIRTSRGISTGRETWTRSVPNSRRNRVSRIVPGSIAGQLSSKSRTKLIQSAIWLCSNVAKSIRAANARRSLKRSLKKSLSAPLSPKLIPTPVKEKGMCTRCCMRSAGSDRANGDRAAIGALKR